MRKKDNRKELFDLLHDKLTPGETSEILSGMKEAGIGDDEIEPIRRISNLIDEAPVDEPSSGMDNRFYEMLDIEREKAGKNISGRRGWFQPSSLSAGLRIAAGIALFLLGWFMSVWSGQRFTPGKEMAELSGELKGLKETLVLTMLNQNSSLERIKAVNMVNEFENADERIIGSLLGALNHDENDNVRLLSLEALIKYSENPAVREGLVTSIHNQSSPMIQLRLAEVMIALNERKAAPEFQKVLMNSGLNYSVRNKINEAVTVLL